MSASSWRLMSVVTCIILFILGSIRADSKDPAISPRVPNDPGYDVREGNLHDFPNGFGWQDWLEAHPPAEGIQDVEVIIGDNGVDCTYPDLKDLCLPALAKNVTDDPFYLDSNTHGFSVAATFAASVNNSISTAGPAGYRGHVKFIPDKSSRDNNSTNSTFHRRVYQHALDLKAQGHNVRLVLFSSSTFGDSEPAASLNLIRALAQQGIIVVAAAGSGGVNLDEASVKQYPAAYAATEPNVIAVAGTDPTGNSLEPASAFGVKTVKWAALGRNVQVPNPTDPTFTQTGSFSGTSAAAPIAAGIYATTYAYRAHNMEKVLRRLDKSCVGPIAGVSCGRPQLGEALKDIPVTLLCEPLESVTQKGSPFSRTSLFSTDNKNRLMLFAENVDAPLASSELSITLEDSKGAVFNGQIEYAAELPNHEWITQINVVLPPGISSGPLKVTLAARGALSTLTVSIQ